MWKRKWTMSKYKFEYQDEGDTITMEFDEVCFGDVLDRFKGFALAVGFQPDTIKSYIGDDNE
jgi:hypothetical protein